MVLNDYLPHALIFKKDLINNDDIIIGNVINAFAQTANFIWALQCLKEQHGFGNDMVNVHSWSDLDGYDRHNFYPEEFDGMLLEFMDEERVVSYEDFYYYIQLACARFIEQHPEKEQEVVDLWNKIVEGFEKRDFVFKADVEDTDDENIKDFINTFSNKGLFLVLLDYLSLNIDNIDKLTGIEFLEQIKKISGENSLSEDDEKLIVNSIDNENILKTDKIYKYLKLAGKRYAQFNPDKKESVETIMKNIENTN